MGKLRTLVWGEAPETKAERKLLIKIDAVILVSHSADRRSLQSYSCIAFFANYLDRAALGNAYV